MLTLDDLRRKAGSKYLAALGATLPAPPDKVSELPASPLFPWAIACGKLTEAEAQGSWLKTVAELQQRARTGSRPGYELHEKRVNTGTRYAWQTLPQQVLFATPADLFAFLGKTTEAAAFQRDATLVLQRLPQLHDWLLARPHLQLLLTYAGKWEGLVRVCEYFLERTTAPPAPRRYLRELPIAGVTTKFIEQHTRPLRLLLDALLPPTLRYEESKFLRRYGLREAEPLVRLRLLDEALSETLPFQLDDFAVPISKFRELDLPCETVFMVENLTTFLALPPLPNTVAVWGKGFQVGALKGTDWLNARRLLYWGDLDAAGLQILNHLRAKFANVHALLMDQTTLNKYQNHHSQPPKPVSPQLLTHLYPNEQLLFDYLAQQNIRLEQEHLPQAELLAALQPYYPAHS